MKFVGTMMASEVPMQSCMRTSSGTSRTRKTSYSTGTITEPPPMPNRPAKTPTTIPATAIHAARNAISLAGKPSTYHLAREGKSGGDVRQIGGRVQHQRERVLEHARIRAGFHRLGRKIPAEGARAGHRAEQAEHVPRDAGELHALRRLALDIRDQRARGVFRGCKRRGLAEDERIDGEQPPRLLVSGATHHR